MAYENDKGLDKMVHEGDKKRDRTLTARDKVAIVPDKNHDKIGDGARQDS